MLLDLGFLCVLFCFILEFKIISLYVLRPFFIIGIGWKQVEILLYFTFDLSTKIDLLKTIIFMTEKFIVFDFLQKKVELNKFYFEELTTWNEVFQNVHIVDI